MPPMNNAPAWQADLGRYENHPRVQQALGENYGPERVRVINAHYDRLKRLGNYDDALNSVGGMPFGLRENRNFDTYLAIQEAQANNFQMPDNLPYMSRANAVAAGHAKETSFNFADELSGVGAAVMAGLQGRDPATAYRNQSQAYRDTQAIAQADRPNAFGAGQVTGVVSTAAVPGGLVAKGGRSARIANNLRQGNYGGALREAATDVAKTIGTGAFFGAGYGALSGAGEGETAEERVELARERGTIGALLGAPLAPIVRYGVAPAIGAVAYKFGTSAENKALDAVIKRMERSGTSLDEVQRQFKTWRRSGQVPETLSEMMGPNERSLLSGLITAMRETRERATDVFTSRNADELDWLEERVARAFGTSRDDFLRVRGEVAAERSREPATFYQAAHFDDAGNFKLLPEQQQASLDEVLLSDPDSAAFLTAAAKDVGREIGRRTNDFTAQRQLLDYAEALQKRMAGEDVPLPPLSVASADYIERQINSAFDTARSGQQTPFGTASSLRILRDTVRASIDDGTGLAQARASAAEAIRNSELIDEGTDIFKRSVKPYDVQANVDEASERGLEAYRAGVSQGISNELRDQPDFAGFADRARQIQRTPNTREKLNIVRPQVLTSRGVPDRRSRQTAANDALDEGLGRVHDRSRFATDMVGNSPTSFRLADLESGQIDESLQTAMGDAATGRFLSGLGNLARGATRRVVDFATRPGLYNPRFNQEASNVLLATGDDIPVQIQKLRERMNRQSPESLRNQLPQRGNNAAEQGFISGELLNSPTATGAIAGGTIGAINPDLNGDGRVTPTERLMGIGIGLVGGGAAGRLDARMLPRRGASNGVPTRNTNLPMDEASRLRRAREMGFDTDRTAYRGLTRPYDAGKAGTYQMFTSSASDASGFAGNGGIEGGTVVPAVLRRGRILPVDGRGNNFNAIPIEDLPETIQTRLHPSVRSRGLATTDDIAHAARGEGYDSVSVSNVYDNVQGEIPQKPQGTKTNWTQSDDDLLSELEAAGLTAESSRSVPASGADMPLPNTDPVNVDVIFDPKNIRSKFARFDPAQSDSPILTAGLPMLQPNPAAIAQKVRQPLDRPRTLPGEPRTDAIMSRKPADLPNGIEQQYITYARDLYSRFGLNPAEIAQYTGRNIQFVNDALGARSAANLPALGAAGLGVAGVAATGQAINESLREEGEQSPFYTPAMRITDDMQAPRPSMSLETAYDQLGFTPDEVAAARQSGRDLANDALARGRALAPQLLQPGAQAELNALAQSLVPLIDQGLVTPEAARKQLVEKAAELGLPEDRIPQR